jgi:hypothetical protein
LPLPFGAYEAIHGDTNRPIAVGEAFALIDADDSDPVLSLLDLGAQPSQFASDYRDLVGRPILPLRGFKDPSRWPLHVSDLSAAAAREDTPDRL